MSTLCPEPLWGCLPTYGIFQWDYRVWGEQLLKAYNSVTIRVF